jgi:hypothetical protein
VTYTPTGAGSPITIGDDGSGNLKLNNTIYGSVVLSTGVITINANDPATISVAYETAYNPFIVNTSFLCTSTAAAGTAETYSTGSMSFVIASRTLPAPITLSYDPNATAGQEADILKESFWMTLKNA